MNGVTLRRGVITVALLGVGVAVWVQTARFNEANRRNAALRAQAEASASAADAAKAQLARAIQTAENDPRIVELARLRAELTALRQQHTAVTTENARLRQAMEDTGRPAPRAAEEDRAPADPAQEAFKIVGIARLDYARQWGLAFHQFAAQHEGRMPATLEEAAAFFGQTGAELPETVFDEASRSYLVTTEVGAVPTVTVVSPDQYELMYRGILDDLQNPAMTIVMREKAASPAPDGKGLVRTYLFADGHSEIHRAPDGDFTAWEEARLAAASR